MTDGRFGIREQVVLIGPVASGKSCLLYQIEKGEFNKQQELTYVIEHGKKDFQVETSNGRVPGRLQIWDTSGVEDHVEITSSYYSKAKVIAVCLRVSDPGWKVEADKWIQEITTTKSNAKIVFVATQSDDTTGTNYTEAMRTYANDKGYPFFVTSAKTGKYTDIDGVEKNIHNDFGNSLAREMGYTVTRNLSLESKSASAPITASPVRPRVSFDESDSFDPEAIIGFSLTGIGLVMLTFAFLTFPPFHLIPHPAVSTFLALFGSIFCFGGAIVLTHINWFGNNWKAENKGRVVALALAAFIFAAALVTLFTLSLGSYAQLFSDTFAGHSGYKVYSQIALFITGASFALGLVASLYQCINFRAFFNAISSCFRTSSVSDDAPSDDLGPLLTQKAYDSTRNQFSTTASTSVSGTSDVSSYLGDRAGWDTLSITPIGSPPVHDGALSPLSSGSDSIPSLSSDSSASHTSSGPAY